MKKGRNKKNDMEEEKSQAELNLKKELLEMRTNIHPKKQQLVVDCLDAKIKDNNK